MIWPVTFEERLASWYHLRELTKSQPLDAALMAVNDWWWRAPMVTRSLLWQDPPAWPGPWDLVSQNGFCDLARALGILYTVMMVARDDIESIELIATTDHNLVRVDGGKYILNWSPGTVVNNLSPGITIHRSISSREFERLIG